MRLLIRRRPITFLLILLFLFMVFYLGRITSDAPECSLLSKAAGDTHSTEKLKTHLIILIMSGPNEVNERQTVRETWLNIGSFDKSEIVPLFPIGTKDISENERKRLEVEAVEYKDLVFIDKLADSFDNLSKKTAFGIEIAVRDYNFSYLLKTDTDSFVRVGYLLKALQDIDNPLLYWGFLDGRAKPFRRGKYKESGYVLCDRYLPYQLGGGYVLSYKLCSFIASNVDLLRFYRSEDASVGFWIAGLKVKYVHDPRFDTEFISRGCNNRYLVTHKHSKQQLIKFANNIRETGRLCESEFQLRPSYVYDFSVPPSQCCSRVNNGSNIP
ncbi:Hexosyltransferase [Aphelenchoides bicaudatus]|nr:Hexosyltransferase [Aphelenchoides bicaudatus]